MALLKSVYPETSLTNWSREVIYDVDITDFQKSGPPHRNLNNDDPFIRYRFIHKNINKTNMETVRDFYNARQGAFDSFYFKDIDDFDVTNIDVGTGDGIQTQFQLTKIPVIPGTLVMILDGSASTSGFTVDEDSGVVTFTSAPAYGVDINATYERLRHVLFKKSMAFTRPSYNTYNIQVELITIE